MREIKFRIWDATPTKDGFPGLMIDMNYAMSSTYLIDGINGKYPIMQYTGLKDKNGNEIYEGDVVVFDLGGKHEANPVEISWHIGGFKYQSMFEMGHTCKVIGNIYENPELTSSPKKHTPNKQKQT